MVWASLSLRLIIIGKLEFISFIYVYLLPFSMKMARVTPRSRNWIFRIQPSTCEISTTKGQKDIILVYLESYKRGDVRPSKFFSKKSIFE